MLHLVVDGANVVGSRPDGWWRDRAGAAARLAERIATALSAGTLFTTAGGDFSAGLAFAVGTFGGRDKSFTAGLGLGYTKEEDEDFQFAQHPIIVLGGNVRLSNNVAFISENWFITGENLTLGQQPLAFAFRFFGDQPRKPAN